MTTGLRSCDMNAIDDAANPWSTPALQCYVKYIITKKATHYLLSNIGVCHEDVFAFTPELIPRFNVQQNNTIV